MYNSSKCFLAAVMLSTAVLNGCSGSDTTSATPAPSTPAAPAAAGAPAGAAFLGPISGASVSLYNVNPNGSSVLPALETVTSGANGFVFTQIPGGTFRICATGGTYTDEATATSVANTTLTLCALVDASKAGTGRLSISPFTTLIDNLAVANPQHAATLLAALNNSVTAITNFFALNGDPTLFTPQFAAPTDPLSNGYKQGILLGGYSQQGATFFANCAGIVPANRHELLRAMFEDVKDGVFDGRLNGVQLFADCNGVPTAVPATTGTVGLLNAITAFQATPLGATMQLAANAATLQTINNSIATSSLAPPQVTVAPSQGLIAIDGRNNVGYVPIYSIDASSNAKIAVVDLTVGSANPIIKTLSLPGSRRPIAATINPAANRVYVEAQTPAGLVNVHVIDTTTQTVISTVVATGVTFSGSFGGIIADPSAQHLIVAGTSNIGIMSLANDPPTMIAGSLINSISGGTDSIAFNSTTGMLFVSSDGSKSVVDTTVNPPVQYLVNMALGTTDGVAFDAGTNLLVVTQEFVDISFVLNFSGATLAQNMALPFVPVPGYGVTAPLGEGPTGQAVVNVITHQSVVADEFGHNLRLIQLPSAPIVGAPNNHGQSGSGTTADASSAYSIAATILPKPLINGVATQLGILGDPNSLTIDAGHNFVYALSDTTASFHGWTPGSTTPLFLVRIDLSAPVFGASPTQVTQWTPSAQAIRMP